MNNMWTDFFTWQGRLNRRPYFFRGLLISCITKLAYDIPKAYKLEFQPALQALVVLVGLLTIILGVFQLIKRLHDLNLSGWYALLILVPLVNLFFGLYLTFARGMTGPNRFGADPLAGAPLPRAENR